MPINHHAVKSLSKAIVNEIHHFGCNNEEVRLSLAIAAGYFVCKAAVQHIEDTLNSTQNEQAMIDLINSVSEDG